MKHDLNLSVRIASRILNKFFNSELKNNKSKLTICQFNLLSLINDNQGLNGSELARIAHMDRTTFTRDSVYLIKDGYVTNGKIKGKKSLSLQLTKRGKQILEEYKPMVTEIEKKLIEQYTNKVDVSKLTTLLNDFIYFFQFL